MPFAPGGQRRDQHQPAAGSGLPPASPVARRPVAHSWAQAGPGTTPASPRHRPGIAPASLQHHPGMAPVWPWWHLPAGGGAGQRPPHAGAGGVQVVGQVALQLPQGEVWPRACHHRRCRERGGSGKAWHCPPPGRKGTPSPQPGWGSCQDAAVPAQRGGGGGIMVALTSGHLDELGDAEHPRGDKAFLEVC